MVDASPQEMCWCQSGLPASACHVAHHNEAFTPRHPRDLHYTPPSHISQSRLVELARNLTSGDTGITVTPLEDARFKVALAAPTQLLRHYPVFRHAPPQARYESPPLNLASFWPHLEAPTIDIQACWDTLRSPRQIEAAELRSFHSAIYGAVLRNTPDDTAACLKDLLPYFLQHFPHGTVDCVIFSPLCIRGPRAQTNLAALHMQPLDELMSRYNSDKTDAGGPHYIGFDVEPFYSTLNNISFPMSTGFVVKHSSFCLLFDYGAPIGIPVDSVRERAARDVTVQLFAPSTTTLTPRLASPGARHLLRVWLARRLNSLFAHLSAPDTYAAKTDYYDPEKQWQDMLTVHDIATITNLLLTESQQTIAVLLFFDLVDRYAALRGPGASPLDVLSRRFVDRVAAHMDSGLGPLQTVLASDLTDSWTRVRDELWNGLLDAKERSAESLTVRRADGTVEETLSKDLFARNMLYALRNTTHGYALGSRRFGRYLVRHNGKIPEAVRYLALGLWFGLLSKPQLFSGGRADFGSLVASPLPDNTA